jgi:hypothetical protein
VVGSGVGGPERAAKLAHDSAQVGKKIVVKRSGDERLAVLGAKDNVREEVRVGVGYVLSPLRGLGEFYSNFSPTTCAVGYYAGYDSKLISRRLEGGMQPYPLHPGTLTFRRYDVGPECSDGKRR